MHPRARALLTQLAGVYLSVGRPRHALLLLHPLGEGGPTGCVHLMRARALSALGRDDEARRSIAAARAFGLPHGQGRDWAIARFVRSLAPAASSPLVSVDSAGEAPR